MTPVVPVVARSGTCLYGLKKGVPPPPSLGGKNTGVFLEKSWFRPMLGNPRQSCLDSTPGILDSVIFVSGT